MAVDNKSPYLPKSKGMDFISSLRTNVAYRVWKRKLKQYAQFNQNSQFKLLEVGCGPGYFLKCIEKWYPKCQPIKMVPQMSTNWDRYRSESRRIC